MKRSRDAVLAGVLGAVGAGLLTSLWQSEVHAQADCVPNNVGGCLGWGIPVLLIGPYAAVAVIWATLRALAVDRPLLSALFGALATASGTLLYEAGHPRWVPPPVWLAVLLGAVGFAVGTAIGGGRTRLLQVVLAGVLAVPLAAFPLLRQETRSDVREDGFARLGLPLLVPQVEGYQVVFARAELRDPMLAVTVMKGDRRISISVLPLPADFAPPQRCGPTVAEVSVRDIVTAPTRTNGPCQWVESEHWVRVENDQRVHLLRRDGAFVQVSRGDDVPDVDVEAAAATLTSVSPRRLAELSVR